jgi:hypothetical protein
MKRVWELTVSSEKDSSPHPFALASQINDHIHSLPSNHLNYPHTGDVHTLTFENSDFEVTFRSRRTVTSDIIIWGEVLSSGLKGQEPFGADITSQNGLSSRGWMHASREEFDEWKSII